MDEKLKKDVEAIVATIFSEKEEADIRKKTEDALNKSAKTIEDLTNTLETKNSEVSELEEKLSEGEEKIGNLESELEAAKKEVESSNEKLAETENTINEMKKDRAAEVRMSELEKAGVAGSNKETQAAKIREMSDDEFASYKNELSDLRQAILDELKTETTEEVAEEEAEETAETTEETEEVAEEETEETAEETETADETEEGAEESEEEETTQPANISPGKAVAAALNMEITPSSDVIAKYRKLGQAMADNITKDKK